jgi:hypothetical protein
LFPVISLRSITMLLTLFGLYALKPYWPLVCRQLPRTTFLVPTIRPAPELFRIVLPSTVQPAAALWLTTPSSLVLRGVPKFWMVRFLICTSVA